MHSLNCTHFTRSFQNLALKLYFSLIMQNNVLQMEMICRLTLNLTREMHGKDLECKIEINSTNKYNDNASKHSGSSLTLDVQCEFLLFIFILDIYKNVKWNRGRWLVPRSFCDCSHMRGLYASKTWFFSNEFWKSANIRKIKI